MITRSYEFNKINIDSYNYYLFYGENNGLKDELIETHFKKQFRENLYKYDENFILKNEDSFFDEILTKSFFEEKKLIIITSSTSKIVPIIEEIIRKDITDIFIILVAEKLEKKSKLRSLFEKNKNTICVPFYSDNYQTFFYIIEKFFKEKKIPISREIINEIINRTNGDRLYLRNEMAKIEDFSKNKKKIELNDILKLINVVENKDFNELVDTCLSKNEKKLKYIVNENNFTNDDIILILRIFLSKVKRLLKIRNEMYSNENLDNIISSFKPTIFWKEKDIVKKQVAIYSKDSLEALIKKLFDVELKIKKNYENSINILLDFILNQAKIPNN